MFWNIFLNLCKQVNKSANAVGKEIGVSSGSITTWKNGRVPHHDTLLKIADYFGVSVDYLLGNEKEIVLPELPEGLSEQDAKIVSLLVNLPDDKKQQVLSYLQFLAEKNKASEEKQ